MEYLAQQNEYAAKAYAQQAAVAQTSGGAQTTIMSAAHMEMDNLIECIGRNTARLRDIRDRLFGLQAEKAGPASTPRPVPNGAVQLLGEKVETAKALLREQTALTDELGRIA